jgi:hypothetical protein
MITAAARSKALVYGRSPDVIMGSNPSGGMDWIGQAQDRGRW